MGELEFFFCFVVTFILSCVAIGILFAPFSETAGAEGKFNWALYSALVTSIVSCFCFFCLFDSEVDLHDKSQCQTQQQVQDQDTIILYDNKGQAYIVDEKGVIK